MLTSLLLFVWPIPGTIALRNVLAGLLLVVLLLNLWKCRYLTRPPLTALWLPVKLFATLTAWILLVIVGWSAEPSLSWKEFWAQWTIPALCGFAGVLLARQQAGQGAVGVQTLLKCVFYTLFLQVLLHDVMDLSFLLLTGQPPFRQAPVLYLPLIAQALQHDQPVLGVFNGQFGEKFSFVNNLFAALVLAEVIQRIVNKTRLIPVPGTVLWSSAALLVLASYWLSFRNGNIGLIALFVTASTLVLVRLRTRLNWKLCVAAAVLALVLLGGLAMSFWKTDPRWQTFAETVPIALDTQTHKAWLTRSIERPRLSNGVIVDESNYERLAWIKEGLKLGWENPLGTGLNRNAFFDGLDRKYQMNGTIRGGHSHSGVVDFFIANGLPGLLLWFAFLLSLAMLGWRTFTGQDMALGLLLIFIVSGSFSRSLVDSNIRDHVLQQFLFLVGVFATLCAARSRNR